MNFNYPGKPIETNCNELRYREFPDLLFGTNGNGQYYFDATAYLQNSPCKTVKDFLDKYQGPIEAILEVYGIDSDSVVRQNPQGNCLLDAALTYIFISYTDPHFLAFTCERLEDLFTVGFTVSDSYLVAQARDRLPDDALKEPDEDGTESE